MRSISRVWAAGNPSAPVAALFGVAAVAVGVAGALHGRLFHEGYEQVSIVGPLFALNVVGSAAVILLLLARRTLLFAGGALAISAGAIVSIVISHESSFFRFSESGYNATARAIIAAEGIAAAATLMGLVVDRAVGTHTRPARPERRA